MPIEWQCTKKIPSWLGQVISLLKMDIQRNPLREDETPAMRLCELRIITTIDDEGKSTGHVGLEECEEIIEDVDFNNFRVYRTPS